MNEQGIMEKLCSGVNPVTGKLLDTPRDPEIDEARVKYFRLLGTRVKAIEKAKAKAENTAPKNTGGIQSALQISYPSHGRPWTPALTEELKRQWSEGATIDRIAGEMGRTPGAVAAQIGKVLVIEDQILGQENLRRGGEFVPPIRATARSRANPERRAVDA